MLAEGSELVVRDVWKGRVWDAVAVVVVHHDDDWLVDHQAVGSVLLGRTCRGRAKLDALEQLEWSVAPTVVTEPGINFYRRDGWSRIGMAWSSDYAEFRGWYVNLQQPLRPSRLGFDTMDLILDVRISPSGKWAWKDEDDFHEAIDRDILGREVDAILRGEVEQVLRLLGAAQGPFDPRWQEWRPPVGMPIPTLPTDVETMVGKVSRYRQRSAATGRPARSVTRDNTHGGLDRVAFIAPVRATAIVPRRGCREGGAGGIPPTATASGANGRHGGWPGRRGRAEGGGRQPLRRRRRSELRSRQQWCCRLQSRSRGAI